MNSDKQNKWETDLINDLADLYKVTADKIIAKVNARKDIKEIMKYHYDRSELASEIALYIKMYYLPAKM